MKLIEVEYLEESSKAIFFNVTFEKNLNWFKSSKEVTKRAFLEKWKDFKGGWYYGNNFQWADNTTNSYKYDSAFIEEMVLKYEHIIKSWNSVIDKRDMIYILGDLTMEKKRDYSLLDLLKGDKNVVLGNHDRRQDVVEMLKYVNSVAGMINYKSKIILTHCPIHPCELDYRFSHNIHGHVHENSLKDKRYINVSCEVVDYTPKLLTELL